MAEKPFSGKEAQRKPALKKRALNQAGESLTRERDRLLEEALFVALAALATVGIAALEFWRWWTKTRLTRPQPRSLQSSSPPMR